MIKKGKKKKMMMMMMAVLQIGNLQPAGIGKRALATAVAATVSEER